MVKKRSVCEHAMKNYRWAWILVRDNYKVYNNKLLHKGSLIQKIIIWFNYHSDL